MLVTHRKKSLNIDIGNRCTLQCSECQRTIARSQGKSLPGSDMTLEQFDKISNFFKGRWIYFCGTWGDPIFNPYFIDMLKMCKAKDINVNVHTAASHRPKEWYAEAFAANQKAKWVFGIDGLPGQSHIYRKNQDGEKLFEIMKMCRSLGMSTVWQYIVFPYNKGNIETAHALAKEIDVRFLTIYTTRNQRFLNTI